VVQVDGAPLVATGLTDLLELGHKGKDAQILSGVIVEGLAAVTTGGGIAQRIREESFSASGTWALPPASFLVQPAPETKSNLTFGRMVWASAESCFPGR